MLGTIEQQQVPGSAPLGTVPPTLVPPGTTHRPRCRWNEMPVQTGSSGDGRKFYECVEVGYFQLPEAMLLNYTGIEIPHMDMFDIPGMLFNGGVYLGVAYALYTLFKKGGK